MDKNLAYTVTEAQTNVKQKIAKGIQNHLMVIALIANIAVSVVTQLYQIGFKNPFTVSFLVGLSLTITTSMVSYCVFIPFGKREERKLNKSYEKNATLWAKLTETVRAGYNELFGRFCREQLEVEREEKRRAIICNNTIISYCYYETEFKGKSKQYINNLVKAGQLSKKEGKAINRANGNSFINFVKVRPINPVIILSGVKSNQINDAGRTNSLYTANSIISRPIIILIVSVITESLTSTFLGGGANVVFDICIGILKIVTSAVLGYGVGVNSVRQDNEKVKSRILFLSLFAEKNGLKIEK